jgi:DNA-binding LacI/PurR family transcriptional regulator
VRRNSLHKKPTISDIAQLAGVSTATVSLVLNEKGNISTATRESVLSIARKLGYTPVNRSSTEDRSKVFALIIEELPIPLYSDPFCSQIVAGMEEEARNVGYGMLLVTVPKVNGSFAVPDNLRQLQPNGMIILGGGDLVDSLVHDIIHLGFPAVIVDNYLSACEENLVCVVADNFHAGYLATEHLIKCGKQNIAIIKGSDKYKPLKERFYGYLAALTDSGYAIRPEYICEKRSHGSHKGCLETEYLLSLPHRPDAILCISDKVAFNALDVAANMGVKVPQDVSIIGIDNLLEGTKTTPPLTTVNIPKKEMGQTAVRVLLSLVENKEAPWGKLCLPVELVVRDSVLPSSGLRIQEP